MIKILKQYIIIPRKPKMSPGKIASQSSHASTMALFKQQTFWSGHNTIDAWIKSGMCVIVLECKDTLELMGIDKYLDQWKVTHHMYIDEGHTEVSMGTPTALATGVLTEEQQWMFDKMKLYGDKNAFM